jgi:nicotinate-nucleotide adenylyltransferase
MRLGIFGGSFDPVHNGHLALAQSCQEQADLDEVWFTPTAVQPLKQHGPQASDADRIAMLNLAIDPLLGASQIPSEPGRPRPLRAGASPPPLQKTWRVCTLETDRGGVSYTVETLRQIHVELPEAELFFLIGADALRDVDKWREPRGIFRLATPLAVCRADEPPPDLAALTALCTEGTCPRLITMPPVDISSSEIRRRAAAQEPIDSLVPPAVAAYIIEHALYRPARAERNSP